MQLILGEDGDERDQGTSQLERNVLVFGSFSHLCLTLKALSGCGKSFVGNFI